MLLCVEYDKILKYGTAELIRESAEIGEILLSLGLRAEDVEDYHHFPVADNDPPRLSADRLDYTLGNAVNFGLASVGELTEIFADLRAGVNEFAETELVFQHAEKAARFAELALECSKIYVCDADRYAMQMLSELLRDAIEAGVLDEKDLAATEEQVVAKLLADEAFAARWTAFRALSRTERAEREDEREGWRRIPAKKRRIDPYVEGRGRVSALDPALGAAIEAFLNEDIGYFVRGEGT